MRLNESLSAALQNPEAGLKALLARKRKKTAERARGNLADWSVGLDCIPALHHQYLIDRLEAVERGELKRLIVCMPPGGAKSTYASINFPPWFLGRNPLKNIITASYAQRLSDRFGKKCRNIVRSRFFGETFGFNLSPGTTAKNEWEVEPGGEYTASSVDGSVTGRRADVLLVDDPIKGRKEADSVTIRDTLWEWYLSDARTRLKPGGAIIIILTRWHEDDLVGRILPEDYKGESGKIMSRDGEEWEVVSIRAEAEDDDVLGRAPGEMLWPEWFTGGMLQREKIVQGPRNWNALYQQRPAPEEGSYFKREWLRYYDTPPEHLRNYGASDYAVTADDGDFTVHGIVGVDPKDDIYLRDLWRKQTTTDVWIEALLDLAEQYKPMEWAEESGQILKSVGPFISKRMTEREVYFYRHQYTSATDKPTRAQSIRGRFAMGKVYLPRSAPWVPPLVAEMMAFDGGKNDDQVDFLSLIGRMLDRMLKGKVPKPDPKPRTLVVGDGSTVTMNDLWALNRKRSNGRI